MSSQNPVALQQKHIRPPTYSPVLHSAARNFSGLYLSENRNKSLTLISVEWDNFRYIFPKYAQRANTVISACMPGRTASAMGNKQTHTPSPLSNFLPYPPALTPLARVFFYSFTTIRCRTVCSVQYFKCALWFLLILRLHNLFMGENSNSKELLLIENLYIRC